mgnify:CR=1 FL=1
MNAMTSIVNQTSLKIRKNMSGAGPIQQVFINQRNNEKSLIIIYLIDIKRIKRLSEIILHFSLKMIKTLLATTLLAAIFSMQVEQNQGCLILWIFNFTGSKETLNNFYKSRSSLQNCLDNFRS